MRTHLFLITMFLAAPSFAAEVSTLGFYADGRSTYLPDDLSSQCSFSGLYQAGHVREMDCAQASLPAIKGATYRLQVKATAKSKRGFDPIYVCNRGCRQGVVRTIKYITEESGC
jgi:hypothetical protein